MGIICDPISQIFNEALPTDLMAIPSTLFDEITADPALVQNPNQFNLFVHPDTKRFQESSDGPFLNVDTEAFHAFEVARFIVPYGKTGVIKSIEQVLWDRDGSIYPTSNEYWGAPYFVDNEINQNRWYLTIDNFEGQFLPRVNFTSAAFIPITDLPGVPYPELSDINMIWYPVHCPASQNLNFVVPQSKVLRMFWVCPPTENYNWFGTGRLRGYTQSTFSNDAMTNARRNY